MELLTDSCCSPTPPGASRVPPVSAEGSGIALELPPKPALPPALFSHPPIQCQQVPWALPSNLSRMLTPSQSAPWSAPIISHVDQFSTLPPPWFPGSRPCSPQAISPQQPPEGLCEHLCQGWASSASRTHLPQGKSQSPPRGPQGRCLHLPLPALTSSLSPPCTLCFSHTGLAVPPSCQAPSCPRAFAQDVLHT